MHGENVVVEMDDLFEINRLETSIVGNEMVFIDSNFQNIVVERSLQNGIIKNSAFITKYSDAALRALKGKKAVKEYLNENVESYVKEKDFTSLSVDRKSVV